MSQRDRSDRGSGFGDEMAGGTGGDGQSSESGARPKTPAELDESFDLPAWGTTGSRRSSRDSGGSQGASRTQRRSDQESAATGASKRKPIPTLGDVFRSPSHRKDSPSSPPAMDAASGRQRRPASQSTRELDPVSGEAFEDPYLPGYLEDDFDEATVAPLEPRSRRRRSPEPRTHSARLSTSQQFGGLIAAAAPQARLAATVGGIVALSLVLMAATLLGRIDSLPNWIPIHLNAEGEPDLWGTSSTLWRIPLMMLMLTIMSLFAAWYLWKRDQFAARFTLLSTLMIHALGWIALVNFVW